MLLERTGIRSRSVGEKVRILVLDVVVRDYRRERPGRTLLVEGAEAGM